MAESKKSGHLGPSTGKMQELISQKMLKQPEKIFICHGNFPYAILRIGQCQILSDKVEFNIVQVPGFKIKCNVKIGWLEICYRTPQILNFIKKNLLALQHYVGENLKLIPGHEFPDFYILELEIPFFMMECASLTLHILCQENPMLSCQAWKIVRNIARGSMIILGFSITRECFYRLKQLKHAVSFKSRLFFGNLDKREVDFSCNFLENYCSSVDVMPRAASKEVNLQITKRKGAPRLVSSLPECEIIEVQKSSDAEKRTGDVLRKKVSAKHSDLVEKKEKRKLDKKIKRIKKHKECMDEQKVSQIFDDNPKNNSCSIENHKNSIVKEARNEMVSVDAGNLPADGQMPKLASPSKVKVFLNSSNLVASADCQPVNSFSAGDLLFVEPKNGNTPSVTYLTQSAKLSVVGSKNIPLVIDLTTDENETDSQIKDLTLVQPINAVESIKKVNDCGSIGENKFSCLEDGENCLSTAKKLGCHNLQLDFSKVPETLNEALDRFSKHLLQFGVDPTEAQRRAKEAVTNYNKYKKLNEPLSCSSAIKKPYILFDARLTLDIFENLLLFDESLNQPAAITPHNYVVLSSDNFPNGILTTSEVRDAKKNLNHFISQLPVKLFIKIEAHLGWLTLYFGNVACRKWLAKFVDLKKNIGICYQLFNSCNVAAFKGISISSLHYFLGKEEILKCLTEENSNLNCESWRIISLEESNLQDIISILINDQSFHELEKIAFSVKYKCNFYTAQPFVYGGDESAGGNPNKDKSLSAKEPEVQSCLDVRKWATGNGATEKTNILENVKKKVSGTKAKPVFKYIENFSVTKVFSETLNVKKCTSCRNRRKSCGSGGRTSNISRSAGREGMEKMRLDISRSWSRGSRDRSRSWSRGSRDSSRSRSRGSRDGSGSMSRGNRDRSRSRSRAGRTSMVDIRSSFISRESQLPSTETGRHDRSKSKETRERCRHHCHGRCGSKTVDERARRKKSKSWSRDSNHTDVERCEDIERLKTRRPKKRSRRKSMNGICNNNQKPEDIQRKKSIKEYNKAMAKLINRRRLSGEQSVTKNLLESIPSAELSDQCGLDDSCKSKDIQERNEHSRADHHLIDCKSVALDPQSQCTRELLSSQNAPCSELEKFCKFLVDLKSTCDFFKSCQTEVNNN